MADTYTTSLELRVQTVGGNNNTWGGFLNTDLGNIDSSIGGVLSVSLASADVTLSAAQNRNPVVVCTGTLSANRELIVKTQTKHFWIHNNTSGAYTVTVKTAAGTGVAVPQGEWRKVYCDGTNVETISGSLASYSSVTAALIAAGAVDTDALADDGVTQAKIAAGAVGTTEQADNSVTLAKLEDGSDGNILYYGASGAPARLAAGTEDQVLAADSNQRPSWQSLGNIAGFELRSLTANGYQTFPGGFTVMWGTNTVNDGTNKAISFPTTFASACQGVFVTTNSSGLVGVATDMSMTAINVTTSGFSVSSTFNGTSVPFFWLAIGY